MKTIKTAMMILSALTAMSGAALADSPAAAAARADMQKTLGFVPQFVLKLPEEMLPGMWDEIKGLQMNPKTVLSGRTKELIGLGVSAQIPCRYCIIAHTEFARADGASDKEIGEAVGMAAITRHWSTFLNGIQIDETHFRGEVARLIEAAKAKKAGGLPDFVERFPEGGRAGAWKQMRDLQMNPDTALSGKQKELIGLAVSAQIPCRYCIIAHTEFARLNGATDAEIGEALGMASLTRSMSTVLNGLQIDEVGFRKDVDRLVGKGAKATAQR